jgi:hypothetical protein
MNGVHGVGGECDKHSTADFEKLAPCGKAAQDINARVPHSCCAEVQKMDTKCLCVAVLSEQAKQLGVVVAAAVTIPKRCNIANRAKGYKCGGLLAYLKLTYQFIIIINFLFFPFLK